jgi:dTDP-4-amino-4,6-dideoxygalactose transaminase
MPFALATTSGTAALVLALLAAGVQRGDRVWCSTLTFVATAHAISHVGAVPVFIDSDTSWQISPTLVVEGLDAAAKTGSLPRALIGVHLYGECFDATTIADACKRHGVALIEDACQALGATHRGKPAGSFGDFSVLSFNANKIITTGCGGMVLCRTAQARATVETLANQGRSPTALMWREDHMQCIGHNYRLSDLLAALGRVQLSDLDRRIATRRQIGQNYRAKLNNWNWQPIASGNDWLASATIDCGPDSRDAALGRLQDARVEARPVFVPMHKQPIYQTAPRIEGRTAEALCANGLCLPSTPGTNVDAVVLAIRSDAA